MEQNSKISQFLSIFPAQSPETAIHYLDASAWDVAAAAQLLLDAPSGGAGIGQPPPLRDDRSERRRTEAERALHHVPGRQGAWDPNGGASGQRLAALYQPPFELMYNGSFEQAKRVASVQKKWVLVNLQSTMEFSSHLLDRDTWANDVVAQTIPSHFVFWQAYEDDMDGQKVRTFYKIDSLPAVLVIDSITGQKMRCWKGMVEPQRLLEDLMPFLEKNPFEYFSKGEVLQEPAASRKGKSQDDAEEILQSLSMDEGKEDAELQTGKRVTYPTLPKQPEGDRSLICRIAVRLPDGEKRHRNFLQSDPIQLLWSFCDSLLEEKGRPFQLKLAIPGSSITLDYHSNLTFHESKLSNSLISIAWE